MPAPFGQTVTTKFRQFVPVAVKYTSRLDMRLWLLSLTLGNEFGVPSSARRPETVQPGVVVVVVDEVDEVDEVLVELVLEVELDEGVDVVVDIERTSPTSAMRAVEVIVFGVTGSTPVIRLYGHDTLTWIRSRLATAVLHVTVVPTSFRQVTVTVTPCWPVQPGVDRRHDRVVGVAPHDVGLPVVEDPHPGAVVGRGGRLAALELGHGVLGHAEDDEHQYRHDEGSLDEHRTTVAAETAGRGRAARITGPPPWNCRPPSPSGR